MQNRFWGLQHIQLWELCLCFYCQNAENLLNPLGACKPETTPKAMISSQKTPLRTTFTVDGIRCNHCESNIKLALSKVPGVKRVKVRKRKLVVIDLEVNHTISNLDLAAAIEDAGYQLHDTQ
jgi:copper chaperone CopZ